MKLEKSATAKYYQDNAAEYATATQSLDMREMYGKFLPLIAINGHILDAGTGSGRDAKVFLDNGFRVSATDQSFELAKIAGAYTGIDVKIARHEDLDEIEIYDGIWAHATLLHLERSAIPDALQRMERALKTEGILYISFKHGDGESTDDLGRRYTDMTVETLADTVTSATNLEVLSTEVAADVLGRAGTSWVLLLARKPSSKSK